MPTFKRGNVTFKLPSEKVLEARARRMQRQSAKDARLEWYIQQINTTIRLSLKQRVRLATHLLKDKVVRNISTPVSVGKGPKGGRVVAERSSPGEFPRADTKLLMKTIFEDYKEPSPGVYEGYVGTPLDYGAILELSENLDRSYLVRTKDEEKSKIFRILTGPIK